MIVTGESSGELYGALLAGKLKSLWPDMRVIGVGGERMGRAGVELIAGVASSFGITEAVATYRAVKETFGRTVETIDSERPDVVVLIDFPDFNFRVGKEARKRGIKVLYYVSPQLWAWRRGRVKTMREISDRVAVLLPFEEGIYRDAGIPCEFVGHPALDEINLLPSEKGGLKEALGLDPSKPCLALLPGSRNHELRRLLPVVLDVVRRFKKEFPDYGFILPVAPNMDVGLFRPHMDALEAEGVALSTETAVMALSASEAAVVASGTAALQAAFVGTPLVVIYKVSPLTYLIGRMLIVGIKYVSLVNILMDRLVVKEFLQGDANSEAVMKELRLMLLDGSYRQKMLYDLRAVRGLFEGRAPSMRVAEIVGEMSGWRP